ncbi:MAG: DNA-binding response regulator [Alistipes indistinctus]
MAETVRHRILLIEPSGHRGARNPGDFVAVSEFEVIDTPPDLGHCTERLTLLSPDAVLVDPCLFDYQKRTSVRGVIPCLHEAVLVAVLTGLIDDEALRQYDGSVHLYDEPAQIVRKLRKAIESRDEHAGIPENYELSDRENEIPVAVARA